MYVTERLLTIIRRSLNEHTDEENYHAVTKKKKKKICAYKIIMLACFWHI